uniref:Claudin 3 n=1 Tax=Takifugu rubripes TaxID=31033 RepID=H2UVQ2_TAKRU
MASVGLEILGVSLGVLGWILAIVSCIVPMWRVSAFIGMNIVTAQITWEGIWMNCVVQSTGQMQCKVHDSMLALSADLQAARALTIISIVLGVMGIVVAMMGSKCTNCDATNICGHCANVLRCDAQHKHNLSHSS